MGRIDQELNQCIRERSGRSVLKSTVGNAGVNDPDDLRRIELTLRAIGAVPAPLVNRLDRDAVIGALGAIEPGGDTELAFRRALATGRFPLSHRAAAETASPGSPRGIIGHGIRRAREKLSAPSPGLPGRNDTVRFRRAVLPPVNPPTAQANVRLAAILAGAGDYPEIIEVIAGTLAENGRQGFADVQDLWRRLEGIDPARAARHANAVTSYLTGRPLRRFRKLTLGQPPVEGDFADGPPERAS